MGPSKEGNSKTSGHGWSVSTLFFLKTAQNFSNSNVNTLLGKFSPAELVHSCDFRCHVVKIA